MIAPRRCARTAAVLVALCLPSAAFAQAAVRYRLTLPEPEHRWMQVDVTLPEVPAGPLQLRMSRSSPGRYALHEFARHVFDVRVTDGAGRLLQAVRPNPHQWDITGHDGTVRVEYKVFGDRIDGTYLSVDATHAHVNMPAALLWARGFERRPAIVTFVPPRGGSWRVATQLLPGPDPLTFSAPNLQYLMDSPSEFGAFALRTFTVDDSGRTTTFRIAMHHLGSDAELDAYARDAERIVREMKHVFGEYPRFENDTYTFIADYLPWASGDGMEHRNSTILTSSASLRDAMASLLETVSHEFFHAWNVERIRPQSLEPFDFEDANMSGELWFAEGFTSYYGPLVLQRAGVSTLDTYAAELTGMVNEVLFSPGRQVRTAEEMSRLAPFIDRAAWADPTNFQSTVISYYTWGAAIGLGLDLSLRDRTGGRVTLDDFMRAMWRQFGKSGERVPGYVESPYTVADLKSVLASVSGDETFAADFFARYIQGHEAVDYRRLLARAGFDVRPMHPGAVWLGATTSAAERGHLITEMVPFGSSAYAAGLDRGDVILALGGRPAGLAESLEAVLHDRRPGDQVDVLFESRGRHVQSRVRLGEDPRIVVVAAERAGRQPAEAERRFREAWLQSAAMAELRP